jgi:hypothetical protein
MPKEDDLAQVMDGFMSFVVTTITKAKKKKSGSK